METCKLFEFGIGLYEGILFALFLFKTLEGGRREIPVTCGIALIFFLEYAFISWFDLPLNDTWTYLLPMLAVCLGYKNKVGEKTLWMMC